MTGVTFEQPHFACLDFYVQCFDWVVTPSTDPLYLYPPSSLLYFYETTQDLQQMYLDSGLSTIEENTLVAVIGFTIGNLSPLPKDLDKANSVVVVIFPVFFLTMMIGISCSHIHYKRIWRTIGTSKQWA